MILVLRSLMDPDYKELRKQEYLGGKREWTVSLTNGDYDRFTREYVVPLRQLNNELIFAAWEEIPYAVDGQNVRTAEVFVS